LSVRNHNLVTIEVMQTSSSVSFFESPSDHHAFFFINLLSGLMMFSILTSHHALTIEVMLWKLQVCSRCLHLALSQRPNIYLSRFKCKNFEGFQAMRTNLMSVGISTLTFFFLFYGFQNEW